MKKYTQLLLIAAGVLLLISIFVPIWQIDLDAPQYPEGLGLLIYSNKLAGDVDIINGLNHYIGMKTLHADDFIEFTVLPYIIGFFALFSIVTALVKSKKLLTVLFTAFLLFGIIAMVDFWRWEYDYGHNLDPKAAIIVPGMAYQPPLIGFKQLLNFGAYSIPAIGGIFFILAGLFMLVSVWLERKKKVISTKVNTLLIIGAAFLLSSCAADDSAIVVNYNTDACDNCKMTIVDPQFACGFKTDKGKSLKFDDLSCLKKYMADGSRYSKNVKNFYVSDFLTKKMVNANSVTILKSDQISSPMGGGMASFSNLDSAKEYQNILKAETVNWSMLVQTN